MPRSKPIVAIDGPAGAGKSTLAQALAQRLGFVLMDTGALYRAVALTCQRRHTTWDDDDAVSAVAREIVETGTLVMKADPLAPKGTRVEVAGEDISSAIRAPDISMGASKVSAIASVRTALLDLQRQLADDGGVVAEGRDIGTVVFPNAEVKFFLTASLEVRAQRRRNELLAQGHNVSIEELIADVAQRDRQDSERAVAPLKKADDAILIDSTNRDVELVLDEMVRAVSQATN